VSEDRPNKPFVRRIDPTLPHIKRYESLGIREVSAKARGPGELNNLNTGRNVTGERKSNG